MALTIDEIINNYQNKIYKTCLGFTNNTEEAKDLTQDVLIHLWKGMECFRGDSSLNTWVYRITVNTCLMYKRGTKPKKISLIDIGELPANDDESLEEKNYQLQNLDHMIAQLREKDRLIMILYLEKVSYVQISEIIGISVNYVGVRINRIKKELSKKIKL